MSMEERKKERKKERSKAEGGTFLAERYMRISPSQI